VQFSRKCYFNMNIICSSSITETAVICQQSYYDRKLINNLCTDNFIPNKRKFFKYMEVVSKNEYETNHRL
jgi:hypothetical protein